MEKITLRNDFHNTEATFLLRADGTISGRTMKRILKALCGMDDCTCPKPRFMPVDGEWPSWVDRYYLEAH